MPISGRPLVCVRECSESVALPMQRKPPASVEPVQETCGALGSSSCIIRSRSGTPTLSTSRSADTSAAGKRGCWSTCSQIVSKAGKAIVQRAASSCSTAAPGSNSPTCTNAPPRAKAVKAEHQPPMWNSGSGVQKRSSAVTAQRSAKPSPSATIEAWLCTQPFGLAVVPEV